MTRKEYALNYISCSIGMLRKFVKNRTHQSVSVDQTKEELIAILELCDASASINFFEFSPEIRNMVYENLVIAKPRSKSRRLMKGNHLTTFKNLRTLSKQAYEETKEYVFILATFKIPIVWNINHRLCAESTGNEHEWSKALLKDLIAPENPRKVEVSHSILSTTKALVMLSRMRKIELRIMIRGYGYWFYDDPRSKTARVTRDSRARLQDFLQRLMQQAPQLSNLSIYYMRWYRFENNSEEIYFLGDSIPEMPSNITVDIRNISLNYDSGIKSRFPNSHRSCGSLFITS